MNEATFSVTPLTAMGRVWRYLYPPRWLPPPPELVGMVPGSLSTNIFICLDWRDRLRVLFSGKLSVVVRTQTNVLVDRAASTSLVYALPPGTQPDAPLSWRSDG